jgi:hypothetical protein
MNNPMLPGKAINGKSGKPSVPQQDAGIEELDEQLRILSRRLVKTEKEFRETQRLLVEMKAWLSILGKLSQEEANKTQAKRYMEQAGKSQAASQTNRLPSGNEIS